MVKKILLGLLGTVVLLMLAAFLFANSAPALPAESDEIITSLIASGPTELIQGKTGTCKSGEVNIWYETMSEADSVKGTVLLIMGHSSTAMVWPNYFYQPFLDAGYQVIRYDNRGVGMSDWMEDWDADNPYTLEDMAADAIAVLDANGVDEAHVVGVSQGGMIAQSFAINYPNRLSSLCSIMSSGYFEDERVPELPKSLERTLVKYVLKYGLISSEENAAKLSIAISSMLSGDKEKHVNLKQTVNRTLYELRKRKGMNPNVGDQHTAAILSSGSRLDDLSKIKVPSLVIHGQSDPLVFFEHAEIYAPLIPNAKTLWIKEMGHDLPEVFATRITNAILENISEAQVPSLVEN